MLRGLPPWAWGLEEVGIICRGQGMLDRGRHCIVNGFLCLRPKKSSNRLRAGLVWPSCISGDVSIDSGDRAEFGEQVSKDLIWENMRYEPKAGLLSSM